MRTVTLALPQFGFIVATRAAIGAGLGLLLGSRLAPARRRTVGIGLIAIGAAATVPAVQWIRGGMHRSDPAGGERDSRRIGGARFPSTGDEPM